MSSPTYTFTPGATGANFVPNSIQELGDMVCKLSLQFIRGVESFNPLAKFKKKAPTNGDTIEQAIVKMASAEAFDPTGASALIKKDPEIAVKYFNTWNKRKFHTSISKITMTKVLEKDAPLSDITGPVISSLTEGDKDEDFTQEKALLKWGRQDQNGKVLKLYDTIPTTADGKIDYKNVLISLKDTVEGMKFCNASFNTSSLKRKTNESDIYIFMPYQLKNRIDVDELAGVFNLEKTELKERIITIDTGKEEISNIDTYVIYVLDRNALAIYNRYYDMDNQKNADGAFWNYFLHSEDMYGLSSLFDCGYILVQTEVVGE